MAFIPKATDNEDKIALTALRRAKLEDERKKRFFDAKTRLIGIDMPAIERQIEEKKRARQAELFCNENYAESVKISDKVFTTRIKEEELEKRKNLQDLLTFRYLNQKFENRLEFDINDPEFKKRQIPTRIADDDMRLGVSSVQILEGEDIDANERQKVQTVMQRNWLARQIKERKQIEDAEKAADKIIANSTNVAARRLLKKSEYEEKCRKNEDITCAEYNKKMASEKATALQREKFDEQLDNEAELYNMMTSDMLTENPDVAISRLNPHKKVAFMYRGMSPDELLLFRRDQERHRVDVKKRNNQKKRCDEQLEKQMRDMNKLMITKEEEMAKQEKQLRAKLETNRKALATAQRQQMENIDNLMRTNSISDDFYAQFNKTLR